MPRAAGIVRARASQSRGLATSSLGKTRRQTLRMTLIWAAVDPQQADAELKDRISGCSRALPGGHWEKKVRLNFLS